MSEFITQSLSGFQAMSGWEYIAVLLSMAYLILAMRQSLWCWPAAFASTLIYTILFYNGALLMDSILNTYYMLMAAYGWYCWRYGVIGTAKTINDEEPLAIKSWSGKKHLNIIATTMLVAILLGYAMDNFTHADFAYLDSITTCFSVLATYLVARKVLENWLYWIVIDALSIYMYVHKGFYPTAVLFAFYSLMAIWGYINWSHANNRIPIATNQ
jgi:nicotinamide mononucleotide transporter